jgi:lipopolysaccharide transport system ATP-binding protein
MLETGAEPAARRDATPMPAMSSDVSVRFSGVGKTYRLYESSRDLVVDHFGLYHLPFVRSPRFREFDALCDLDLEVKRGDRLGVVGRNGAGKTTLLKLITRNFAPTTGTVDVRGTVQALMLTGLGFHPEFSGWENIRSSLIFNGLEGDELEEALEDCADFCELGRYLHEPLKTYSQGMKARTQFGAATALAPDILIIDEVLEAGDSYFAAKCARRVERLVQSGCTLLLVSHSSPQVLRFCTRAVWIDRGRVVQQGSALDVVNAYEVHLERESDDLFQRRADAPAESTEHIVAGLQETLADGRTVHRLPAKEGVKVDRISLTTDGKPAESFARRDPVRIDFELRAERSDRFACRYLVTIWDERGRRVARVESRVDEFDAEAGDRRPISVDLGPLLLTAGSYTASLSIYDLGVSSSTAAGRECRFDVLVRPLVFSVSDARTEPGAPVFEYPGAWTMGNGAE